MKNLQLFDTMTLQLRLNYKIISLFSQKALALARVGKRASRWSQMQQMPNLKEPQ